MAKDPFRQLHVFREVSQKGMRVTDCYRLMYKKELWVSAYSNLSRGQLKQIDSSVHLKITTSIQQLKTGTFRFKQNKKDSNLPQLNLSLEEKLLQEVIYIILNNIYEPISYAHTHGFRKNSNQHTALLEIKKDWHKLSWCLRANLKSVHDDMNPYIILKLLSRKVNDRRFLLLIHHLLTNDIMLIYKLSQTFLHIYLYELDRFINEQMKRASFTIKYVRFESEFLIGIASSKKRAMMFQSTILHFLKDEYHLELDKNKLTLYHLELNIPFLEYQFRKRTIKKEKKSIIVLEIPIVKLHQFVQQHGYGQLAIFQISHRRNLQNKSELEILHIYNAELFQLAMYYKLANNAFYLNEVFHLAQKSFLKTIAKKRKRTSKQVAKSMRIAVQGRLSLSRTNKNGHTEHVSFISWTDLSK